MANAIPDPQFLRQFERVSLRIIESVPDNKTVLRLLANLTDCDTIELDRIIASALTSEWNRVDQMKM